ncbi:DegT/DnrJ/EryC1/StrS family aminotransferase [Pseudorhodoplanes sinuspersici]|uniref:Aminotransferase DegT n=1 Tax=Pseudorhodoplanes sinuspersici TaxID=1235591 RepID=A0A1W6ZVE2_9HYPH|nr:DegT/DnrJ/EryC1/StrS family aminotransferase [Pseudorhodoplanes sinuspersici]ARQ00725.1 aminotransferase DegT [Pseudorhodoplanes sinuspersici]RKE72333.1 dTDP-4-amino-4,6-dideoxygalactose transaminase [Pseudorhodoplanes sinuspersici]
MNQHTRIDQRPIPFIDVVAQRRRLGSVIDEATTRVLNHCQFLMGPEVTAFEQQLAAFCGAKHALSCSSGTDALVMTLMAKNIGPGDAVFCPTFTFCATAESAALIGATPVFVDVHADTFNIDVESLKSAINTAKAQGLKPKAVIPVDLFGLPADHDAIAEIADAEKLFILDDAAQGFGGTYKGRDIGTLGHATATSFFPAKPLGCYGDGGAVLTDDDELLSILKSVRIHGQGADKYDNVRLGLTGRLDTIQAAVLIEKLKIFRDEIVTRNRVAQRYSKELKDIATVPVVPEDYESVWAQYTIRLAPGKRDMLAKALQTEGIPTAIYYARPLHRQTAYRQFPVAGNGLPVSEQLADEVISLPMHAYLDEPTQDRIIDAVRRALR